jgi:hypothetical protein
VFDDPRRYGDVGVHDVLGDAVDDQAGVVLFGLHFDFAREVADLALGEAADVELDSEDLALAALGDLRAEEGCVGVTSGRPL